MSLTCPSCKQVVATRDGKHYGTHFPNVLASKPCEMSCKPIVIETIFPQVCELSPDVVENVRFLVFETPLREFAEAILEKTGEAFNKTILEIVVTKECGLRLGLQKGQTRKYETGAGVVTVRAGE